MPCRFKVKKEVSEQKVRSFEVELVEDSVDGAVWICVNGIQVAWLSAARGALGIRCLDDDELEDLEGLAITEEGEIETF